MFFPVQTFSRIGLLFVLLLILSGCNVDKGFIFFPDHQITTTPKDIGLPFEDLYLTTADNVRINAWFVPHPNAHATLLWLHGNGGNLSNRVDQLQKFHAQFPVHILMIDYREYGRSEGSVSEEGTYRDAQAAYDYLATKPNRGTIIVYGQSLGAAVAVETALTRPAHALILEAPFLSIREMAKVHYGWLPVSGLITTRYDNIAKIGKVRVPLLLLHGDRDETVPYAHGQGLFSAAVAPKQFYTIQNAGHNDTYEVGGAGYFKAIAQFIEALPLANTK